MLNSSFKPLRLNRTPQILPSFVLETLADFSLTLCLTCVENSYLLTGLVVSWQMIFLQSCIIDDVPWVFTCIAEPLYIDRERLEAQYLENKIIAKLSTPGIGNFPNLVDLGKLIRCSRHWYPKTLGLYFS